MKSESELMAAFTVAKRQLGMTGTSPFGDLIDRQWFSMFKMGYDYGVAQDIEDSTFNSEIR